MLTQPLKGDVYRIDKLVNRMDFNRQLSTAVSIALPLEQDNLKNNNSNSNSNSNTGSAFKHRRDARRPSP